MIRVVVRFCRLGDCCRFFIVKQMQKAVEEMGKILEALGPDPDHAFLWAYQTFRRALVEPVTLAQYLEALDWMKSAKSTVQAEKTKRR